MKKITHDILNNYPLSTIKKLVKLYNLHTTINLNQTKANLIKELQRKTNLYIDDYNFITMEIKPVNKFDTYIMNQSMKDLKKIQKLKGQLKPLEAFLIDVNNNKPKRKQPKNEMSYDWLYDTPSQRPELEGLFDVPLTSDEKNITDMNVKELRQLAKKIGIKGYSKMKKAELLFILLKNSQNK